MSSIDDIATGYYTLCLGLFGDPEAIGPARLRAEGALKHFTEVFPDAPEYAEALLESLRQSEPYRPGPEFLSCGQGWQAQLDIARKSQQNWQAARVGRFLSDIVSEDPRLVAFGGLLSTSLKDDAGFECLVRNHQGQVVNRVWGSTDAALVKVLGSNPFEWGDQWNENRSSESVEYLFGLATGVPVVSRALEAVGSRLRSRLVGEGLPLAMPAKRGPRF
jgi:hypothetical protein